MTISSWQSELHELTDRIHLLKERKRKQKSDSSIQTCDWHYTEFEEVYT